MLAGASRFSMVWTRIHAYLQWSGRESTPILFSVLACNGGKSAHTPYTCRLTAGRGADFRPPRAKERHDRAICIAGDSRPISRCARCERPSAFYRAGSQPDRLHQSTSRHDVRSARSAYRKHVRLRRASRVAAVFRVAIAARDCRTANASVAVVFRSPIVRAIGFHLSRWRLRYRRASLGT